MKNRNEYDVEHKDMAELGVIIRLVKHGDLAICFLIYDASDMSACIGLTLGNEVDRFCQMLQELNEMYGEDDN